MLTLKVVSLAWNRVFSRLPPAEFQSPSTAEAVALPRLNTQAAAAAMTTVVLVIRFIGLSHQLMGAQDEDRYRASQ
ncbi:MULTISPECIES: hypothetical protein [unclassified Nocardioides]|uniref:hypothetical protein n=1 Tax=unclassified Nocardioides TaxID=2615069 RepID=UPI003608F2E8